MISTVEGTKYKFQNYDQSGNHKIVVPAGIISNSGAGLTDTVTRTTGEACLRFAPETVANKRYSISNLSYTISRGVPAGMEVTLFGYYRRNSTYPTSTATQPTVQLTSADGVLSALATMSPSTSADTWERFSISGVVGSSDTFINVIFSAPTTQSGAVCYFADTQLVIGSAASGTASAFKVGTLWKNGEPTADAPLGGTVDSTYLRGAIWSTYGTDSAAVTAVLDGPITVGTNNDKTGYALTAAQVTQISTATAALVPTVSTTSVAQGVWDAWASSFTAVGTMGKRTLDIVNELRRR
jgi:hypothetical protein